MKTYLISNIHILICCAVGLAYGIARINSKNKPPMYLLFSLFALVSAFLSRVFYTLSIVFHGGIPDTFNIGFLGYAATFLFFLLANIGQMDWLVDDRKSLRPIYRIIPAIVPTAELFAAVIGLFLKNVTFSVRLSFLVITVVAGFAGYFNIKHIIVPDIEFGIVKAVRGNNLIEFAIGILSLAEIGFSVYGLNELILYVQIVLGVLYIAVIPVLSMEVKKWTR